MKDDLSSGAPKELLVPFHHVHANLKTHLGLGEGRPGRNVAFPFEPISIWSDAADAVQPLRHQARRSLSAPSRLRRCPPQRIALTRSSIDQAALSDA